jgi:hypothetical protein
MRMECSGIVSMQRELYDSIRTDSTRGADRIEASADVFRAA